MQELGFNSLYEVIPLLCITLVIIRQIVHKSRSSNLGHKGQSVRLTPSLMTQNLEDLKDENWNYSKETEILRWNNDSLEHVL